MRGKTPKEQPEKEPRRFVPIFQSQFQERKWLTKHGLDKYIPFKDHQIILLRQYFSELDDNGSGSIGVRELEDPLIALGLSQSREEVQKMIEQVDIDGSGRIEFDEFLSIIAKSSHKGNAKGQTEPKSAIHDFFKKMSKGQLSEEMDRTLPFKLNVSNFRRKKILEAIKGSSEKKEKAVKILHAFKKQISVMQSNGQLQGIEIGSEQPSSLGQLKYSKIMPEAKKALSLSKS